MNTIIPTSNINGDISSCKIEKVTVNKERTLFTQSKQDILINSCNKQENYIEVYYELTGLSFTLIIIISIFIMIAGLGLGLKKGWIE